LLQPVQVFSQALLEGVVVAAVDGETAAAGGGLKVRMRQEKLSNGRIQREAVYPVSSGVDKHRRRAVDDVAGRHLLGPRLERRLGIRFFLVIALRQPVDAENGPHRHVHVNVRRPVERI
jgi:hypothetical protein